MGVLRFAAYWQLTAQYSFLWLLLCLLTLFLCIYCDERPLPLTSFNVSDGMELSSECFENIATKDSSPLNTEMTSDHLLPFSSIDCRVDPSALTLRPLMPYDLPAIRVLCIESFPITYPDAWFDEVVSGQLISWGFFDDKVLAGMLIAEAKPLAHCNPEDRTLLTDSHQYVIYLLSLAVAAPYRRHGLATRMLQHLLRTVLEINTIIAAEFKIVPCPPYPRAVFLHVLSTNYAAINFYQRNGFTHHDTLRDYYRIGMTFGDGLSFVLYTNGAQRPVSFSDVCRSISSVFCFPLKALNKALVYLASWS